jgi:hypothetical protein
MQRGGEGLCFGSVEGLLSDENDPHCPPRQRLPSDGFFERAPQSLFRSTLISKGAPSKKH